MPRGAFSAQWSRRPVLLLGLGDSVTAGFGATEGRSYFQRLVANPPDEFPEMRGICLSAVLPGLRAEDHAVSGSTSIQHLEYQVARLRRRPRDTFGIVVMTTGGNDLIHNYGRSAPTEGAMYGVTLQQAEPWIRSFETRLDTMLERLEAVFPGGCRIFLANIYDPTDGVGDARNVGLPPWKDGLEILAAYNAVIARCPSRHPSVHVVNIHDPFIGHGLYCRQFWRRHYHPDDPHYWYYANVEDPNDRGYDALRRLFLLEMSRVLPDTLPK